VLACVADSSASGHRDCKAGCDVLSRLTLQTTAATWDGTLSELSSSHSPNAAFRHRIRFFFLECVSQMRKQNDAAKTSPPQCPGCQSVKSSSTGTANTRADGTYTQYFVCLSCEQTFKQINRQGCCTVGGERQTPTGNVSRSHVTLQLRSAMLKTFQEMYEHSGPTVGQSFEIFLTEHLENIDADFRKSRFVPTVDVGANGHHQQRNPAGHR
jgi:DNA-directed RNA polymerase subunit M/transcription elongation factor TFIIS